VVLRRPALLEHFEKASHEPADGPVADTVSRWPDTGRKSQCDHGPGGLYHVRFLNQS